MTDLWAVPFLRHILIAGVLVAAGLSPMSVYVVLRRIVFSGAAVAEVASAAVALAVLFQIAPFPLALTLTVLSFLALSRLADTTRLPPETLVGMLYAGGSAASVLLIVKAPRGEADILNILFGNILTVEPALLWGMGSIFALVGLLQYAAAKEFLISAYDPDMGRALGIRVGVWNMVFYGALGLAVAVAIRAVGALMTFTMLVAPGASALCLTEKLSRTFQIALVQGIIAAVAGVVLSYQFDLPTGSTIVAILVFFFILSFGAGRLRKS
ncbi:MAG TPA: metal ABC transporter permease [Elusimicrobiota bacterium]|nr:metal ABC transporter permease [Elusimicrobiota bacterium]